MKRTFALILAALAAAALFGDLVYAVLVAAHVSEPAATTIYGLTLRRLWATTAALLALVGVDVNLKGVLYGIAAALPVFRSQVSDISSTSFPPPAFKSHPRWQSMPARRTPCAPSP